MFEFIPPNVPHNVFVIGAGGTGSRLIPLLAQFMHSITRGASPSGWVENPNIWLMDFDHVEEKNLLRQNFIKNDIGKLKAEVLADRYSRAYGVNVIPVAHKVCAANDNIIRSFVTETFSIIHKGSTQTWIDIINSSIVVMCVDSVEARKEILNLFIRYAAGKYKNGMLFIDSGNEDSFGQVSLFNPVILTGAENYENLSSTGEVIPKIVPVTVPISYIPMDPEYYKNLVDTPSQGSCADLNQTLAINAIMATTIMGIIQNYYYRKPFIYNMLSVSLDGGNSTTYNTFKNFQNRALTNERHSNIWKSMNGPGKGSELLFGRYCEYYKLANLATRIQDAMLRDAQELEQVERARVSKELRLKKKSAAKDELSTKEDLTDEFSDGLSILMGNLITPLESLPPSTGPIYSSQPEEIIISRIPQEDLAIDLEPIS